MSIEPTPPASAHSAEADPDSSSGDVPPSPTSPEPLRHPTGDIVKPTGVDASLAAPGTEIRATTGMFPVDRQPNSHRPDERPTGKRLAVLTLTALGVVYGDIGTSPLYALKECFSPIYGLEANRVNIFGVLSLIVWALTLVVSVKYVSFMLRADNRGEGGTFALLALIFPKQAPQSDFTKGRALVALALCGTALLYGDGIITPAMSVLGAMEGLEIAVPSMTEYIVPISVVILALLFAVQRFGTDRVGKMFGPLMLVWFTVIGTLGVMQIVKAPWILTAVNPWHAVVLCTDAWNVGVLRTRFGGARGDWR